MRLGMRESRKQCLLLSACKALWGTHTGPFGPSNDPFFVQLLLPNPGVLNTF